ncbi:DUF4347 domain-containing protein [Desulfuromonas acetoxidans]|uniref:DUF4347 domain-containing protein n=1 Tax=Desulfuromonas acetoxidans TaxID=891 RepID=UPI00292DAD15|nr:DUF4347 domain-containing protein [Desulfuromonas acetoxidans]
MLKRLRNKLGKKGTVQSRRKMQFEALEPRILLSADLGIDQTDGLEDMVPAAIEQPLEQTVTSPDEVQAADDAATVAQQQKQQRLELIVVDSTLTDYQQLVDDLMADTDSADGTRYELHLIDGSTDGFAQVSQLLSNYQNVDAVHLFTHGSEGQLTLGQSSLAADQLDNSADQFTSWSASLTDNADILLYGCNVADGDLGIDFMTTLSELTGADVAASDDATGAGGDWDLEQKTGVIETRSLSAEDYQSRLGDVISTADNDTLIATPDSDTFIFQQTTDSEGQLVGWGSDVINQDQSGGTDAVDFSGVPSDLTFTFTSSDHFTASDDHGNSLDASGIVTLVGGSGEDTLDFSQIKDGSNSVDLVFVIRADGSITITDGNYQVEADGSVTIADSTFELNATGIENLIGGTGSDCFVFEAGAVLPGTIDGTSGETDNLLDYSAYTTSVAVDLESGTLTGASGVSRIQHVIGGSANDVLIGDDSANELTGGAGNDVLLGGSGDDTLSGGAGDDQLSGGDGVDALDGGDGVDTLTEQQDSDISLYDYADSTDVADDAVLVLGEDSELLEHIEQVDLTTGSSDNLVDIASFTLGAVTVSTGDGDDTLDASTSADDLTYTFSSLTDLVLSSTTNNMTVNDVTTIVGGSGYDTLDFSSLSDDLAMVIRADGSVSISDGSYTIEEDGTVTLSGGSVVITASEVNNLIGSNGNTTFVFEDGGAIDGVLDGGPGGTNLLDYSGCTDLNVYVNMISPDGDGSTGSASNTDGISRIHNVLAGDGDDEITGSDEANIIITGAGDDTIYGGGGADTIDAGAGDDILGGGDGVDILIGGEGTDLLDEQLDATSMVLTDTSLTTVVGGVTTTDTLTDIEQAMLTGGDSVNTLDASAFTLGSVALYGEGGDDTLIGSVSDDYLSGGEGSDAISGNGGIDTLIEARDADMVLTDSALTIGAEVDSLSGITHAELTGGDSANVIDASTFTAGNVTLDGGAGDDILYGGSGDDLLTGGAGIDELYGNAGTDTVAESDDVRFILSDTELDMAEGASEEVTLTLDDSVTGGTFTLTYDGETTAAIDYDADAATLEQALSQLDALDSQDISVSRDRISVALDTLLADLNDGAGVAVAAAGTLDLSITLSDGETVVDIDLGTATTLQDILDLITASNAHLTAELGDDGVGIDLSDDLDGDSDLIVAALNDSSAAEDLGILGTGYGASLQGSALTDLFGPWIITFTVNMAGMNVDDITCDAADLDGGTLTVAISQGGQAANLLDSIEQAELVGGISDNIMDASAFSGSVVLYGADGDDTLIGAAGDDELYGNAGFDTLTGGLGDDLIDGGEDEDLLMEQRDASTITLTNTSLTMDSESDTLTGIEVAQLTGGASSNAIDASAFTGLSSDTSRIYLNNGEGVDTSSVTSSSLTGLEDSIELIYLNDGAGVSTVAGAADIQITLTDGSTVSIDLSNAETLQDVLDLIEEASSLLTVVLNDDGNGLTLSDSAAGSGDLTVTALNGSQAANDLGILGSGNGATLDGVPFVAVAGDVRVILSDGTVVDVVLSDADTVEDFLNAFSDAHDNLTAKLNSDGTGINLIDSSGGSQVVSVVALNGAGAVDDLGLSTGTASTTGIEGTALVTGYVILDGGAGDDTLTGTIGDDIITGGLGSDTMDGGLGSDTLEESSTGDFDLGDTSLVMDGGTDTLSSIELATLTGGEAGQTIDAADFSGNTTLISGGGADTLLGGSGNDQFRVDISNLDANDDGVKDEDEKVYVDVGGGSDNELVILGAGGNALLSNIDWIDFADTDGLSLTFSEEDSDTLTVTGTFDFEAASLSGVDITFRAENVNILGATIITDTASEAGDITIEGKAITIDDTTVISALSTGLGEEFDGTINIIAADLFKDFTAIGFANVDYNEATIDIDNATITGGDINILATAEAQKYDIDFGESWIGEKLESVAGSIIQGVERFSLIAGVAVATSKATINIGENAVITGRDVVVHSDATTLAKASPTSLFLGVAVGVVNTVSDVTVAGSLTATGDMTIRATGDNTSNVSASADKSFSFTVAVSVIDSDVMAQVADTASLVVGGNLYVMADTIDHNSTSAESSTGTGGKVGFSVAVSVEDGNTLAYLDGDADVAGNISVVADQKKEAVAGTKFLFVPADQNGVSAISSVAEDGFLDKLKDKVKTKALDATGVSKITDKVKTSVTDFLKKNQTLKALLESPTTNTYDVGAAFAVSVDTNDAVARIGDGVHAVDIEADGDITVSATTSNRPAITAQSSTENDATGVLPTQNQANAKFGGSVAISVGVYDDNADAYISDLTEIDTAGTLTVEAQTLNQIDPMGLWGVNLITPFFNSNTHATYSTDETEPVTVANGDTVSITDNHLGEGETGNWYQYIGSQPEKEFDLATTDFTDETQWEDLGNPIVSQGLDYVGNLMTYLNGNFGLVDNLIDSYTNARSKGQELALAGALTVLVSNHDATATIKSGAQINQNNTGSDGTDYQSGDRDVVVEAASVNHTATMVGNYDFNITSFGDGVKSADGGSGVGASIGVFWYENNVAATIEEGVTLYADSLEVDADNETLAVLLLTSGGKAGNVAFNGAFGGNIVNNTTTAQIDNGSTIVVGSGEVADEDANGASLFVDASDDSYVITVAGAVARSESVGIGASLGVSVTLRDTQAIIGDETGEEAASGIIIVEGDAMVTADNGGFIGTFAVAGASASPKTTTAEAPTDDNPSVTPFKRYRWYSGFGRQQQVRQGLAELANAYGQYADGDEGIGQGHG